MYLHFKTSTHSCVILQTNGIKKITSQQDEFMPNSMILGIVPIIALPHCSKNNLIQPCSHSLYTNTSDLLNMSLKELIR